MEINPEMTFEQLVPTMSEYLTKDDAGEGGILVTIKGFSREMLRGDHGDEEKTVMHFEGDTKPMVLNKTNASLLPVITGAQTAGEAVGRQIIVYNDVTVAFGGRITGGLRIRKATGSNGKPAAEFDDDIPF